MYAIGERINGMFKAVAAAIQQKNPEPIQELAKNQLAAGAQALDVNVGPAAADPLAAMGWMVKAIREVTDGEVWSWRGQGRSSIPARVSRSSSTYSCPWRSSIRLR